MAAITVTAANVVTQTDTTIQRGVAGVTITAGQSLYVNSSNQLALGDADAAVSAVAAGIALHAALAGQPIAYAVGGTLSFGSGVLTVGQVYVIGLTDGDISPYGDLGSGDYPALLGIATTTAILFIHLFSPGVAKP